MVNVTISIYVEMYNKSLSVKLLQTGFVIEENSN